MPYPIQQSTTQSSLVFLLVQSADHISGLTGATPTVTLSKNGGAFASPAGAVTEISNGWYKVAGNATDTNTLGPLVLHADATGADPCDLIVAMVVAYNPQNANLGLTNVSSNVVQIAGAAVNTAVAQVGANVVSYTAGQAPLQPTVAGRTLDVSTTGEAGVDWANVGSPTTSQALTNTTISTTQTVSSVSGAVGSVTGSVGSVTGAVGSVTGNVGGNVNGSVVGSVGSVAGNVAGSVASVTVPVTVGTNNDKTGYTLVQAFPTNFASLAIDASGKVVLQSPTSLKKNTALAAFMFVMYDSTTHQPATGLTVSASRSLAGGAFGACANSPVEVGNGVYSISLAASDTNADVIAFLFTSTGADQTTVVAVTNT